MIGYLKGEVFEHVDGRALVVTGGVGYAVSVPQSPSYLSLAAGKSVELFIHTHVREDALDLYAFASKTEKELFLTLLGVGGIGPKVALGILSKVEPGDLIRALLEGDKDALTQIPGVGKKTAERMVLELADPLRKKVDAGAFGTAGAPAGAVTKGGAVAKGGASVFRDAKDALAGLGYREQEISAALNKLMEEGPKPARVEDLVRSALQRLS